MSFVNVKEYNKLKAKVGELEARIQALEGYGAAVVETVQAKAEPISIPTIEEAVSEEPVKLTVQTLNDLLDGWIVDLLVQAGYSTIKEVDKASDDQLTAIPGIGKATVKRIRKALEG